MRFVDVLIGRRGFALALALLLAVAGYARGFIVTAALADPAGFTLCHGAASQTPSGDAVNHDCCDECVLALAAVLPEPPLVSLPAEVADDAGLTEAVAVAPVTARIWTPRQAQGPPLPGR
jgi:hypothetical protein